jgi:hypothetical protein
LEALCASPCLLPQPRGLLTIEQEAGKYVTDLFDARGIYKNPSDTIDHSIRDAAAAPSNHGLPAGCGLEERNPETLDAIPASKGPARHDKNIGRGVEQRKLGPGHMPGEDHIFCAAHIAREHSQPVFLWAITNDQVSHRAYALPHVPKGPDDHIMPFAFNQTADRENHLGPVQAVLGAQLARIEIGTESVKIHTDRQGLGVGMARSRGLVPSPGVRAVDHDESRASHDSPDNTSNGTTPHIVGHFSAVQIQDIRSAEHALECHANRPEVQVADVDGIDSLSSHNSNRMRNQQDDLHHAPEWMRRDRHALPDHSIGLPHIEGMVTRHVRRQHDQPVRRDRGANALIPGGLSPGHRREVIRDKKRSHPRLPIRRK